MGLERPTRAEATGKLFDVGTKGKAIDLSRWILEAERVVAGVASSKDCGMIKRTETQMLCQRAKTLLSGADNMEKKGSLAWELVPITSARPQRGQARRVGTRRV
jgi:hypothetical protein